MDINNSEQATKLLFALRAYFHLLLKYDDISRYEVEETFKQLTDLLNLRDKAPDNEPGPRVKQSKG